MRIDLNVSSQVHLPEDKHIIYALAYVQCIITMQVTMATQPTINKAVIVKYIYARFVDDTPAVGCT